MIRFMRGQGLGHALSVALFRCAVRLAMRLLPLLSGPALLFAQDELGFRCPNGFTVTQFAGNDLASDVYTLTIDPRGRVTVSGRGYIRFLLDEDGDGRAERAATFAEAPHDGAQGLLWEADTLYFTGDGGLRRFRDADGDGRADGPSELIRAMRTGGEHDAHAIRRGPDGKLYVLAGNMTGIDASNATAPDSPVKEPVAGCLLRFAPDLKQCEIVADGFRNAYDFDFSLDGEVFTYDSDNERCVGLPWYEFTRFYRVIAGGRYGWNGPQHGDFWRCPPYFFDVVAPLCYTGRGSPTGVECYRHSRFPEVYRGAMFIADWTFGKIYAIHIKREGLTYHAVEVELFMESVGDNGFAPTDLAVHPESGDLYISVGGRGTRGAVYRVRYTASGPLVRNTLPATPIPARTARMDEIRRTQILLGDIGCPQARGTIWEGYTSRTGERASCPPQSRKTIPEPQTAPAHAEELNSRITAVRRGFPTGNNDLDRELSRTLALIEDSDPQTLDRVAGKLTATSDPVEDVHYLAVIARLRADRPRPVTRSVARALLLLDRKYAAGGTNRDLHWPQRVRELHAGLAERDPSLNEVMLADPEFGRPEHTLFAEHPAFDKPRAAERFLAYLADHPDQPWTPGLVSAVGELEPQRVFEKLREQWVHRPLREAILRVLARRPEQQDLDRLVEGLSAIDVATASACLDAIIRLAPGRDGTFLAAMIRALRSQSTGKERDKLRLRLCEYLANLTEETAINCDSAAWNGWLAEHHPAFASEAAEAEQADMAVWRKRLAAVDWSRGDRQRGAEVYERIGCRSCHTGLSAMGPDLRGVGQRFSRDDLFTAVLDPSRDVSDQYQGLVIETASGEFYHGFIVYEATDSLLLRTGPDAIVRVPVPEIVDRRRSALSLMPAGQLDQTTDAELADLYAYLRALR